MDEKLGSSTNMFGPVFGKLYAKMEAADQTKIDEKMKALWYTGKKGLYLTKVTKMLDNCSKSKLITKSNADINAVMDKKMALWKKAYAVMPYSATRTAEIADLDKQQTLFMMKAGAECMFEDKEKKMISVLDYLAKRKAKMTETGGVLAATVASFIEAAGKLSQDGAKSAEIEAQFVKDVAAHSAKLKEWMIPAAGALGGDCSQGGRRGMDGMMKMAKEKMGKLMDGKKDGDKKDDDKKDGDKKDGDKKDGVKDIIKDGIKEIKEVLGDRKKCENMDSTDAKVKTCCAAA